MKYLILESIEIARCEQKDYTPFEDLHYLQGICKGSSCFIIRVNKKIAAFASLISMPQRNNTDALIYHRVVIFPSFQGYNLSSLILNFISAIYSSVGKKTYLKTDSTRMNKMLKNNSLWETTSMHQRKHKTTKEDHQKYKSRHIRAAYSYRFKGEPINGYEELTLPISEARKQNILYKNFQIPTLELTRRMYNVKPEILRSVQVLNYTDFKKAYIRFFPEKRRSVKQLYSTENVIRYKHLEKTSKEYRKKILFLNLVIFRHKHECGFEILLCHALEENENQLLGLDTYTLIKLALRAYNEDLNKHYQFLEKIKAHNTYHVDKEAAAEKGISVKSASNIARKGIRYKEITKFYAPSLTDRENIDILAQNGINISLSTLRRFRRKRGIQR